MHFWIVQAIFLVSVVGFAKVAPLCRNGFVTLANESKRSYPVILKETFDGFHVTDPNDPRFGLTAKYSEKNGGTIWFHIRTKIRTPTETVASTSLKGSIEFDEMLRYFKSRGETVLYIRGEWSDDKSPETGAADKDNLDTINKFTGPPHNLTLKEAAAKTWTAQQAFRHGYTEIDVMRPNGEPGNYSFVLVYFKKP